MQSLAKIAVRLSVGLVLTGCFASLPEATAQAGPRSVINKLERFLTGRKSQSRPKKRSAGQGKKSRNQAVPEQRKATLPPEKRGGAKGEAGRAAGDAAPNPAAPVTAATAALALPAVVAVPQFRPDFQPAPDVNAPAAVAESREAIPLPTPAPRTEPESEKVSPDPQPPPEPARDVSSPAGEAACRERLRTLGVRFEERPPEADAAAGCFLSHPVFVTRFADAVKLEPGGLMDCAMAETTARFLRDVVQPAAREAMGSDLTGIGQASAYVCRTRHGKSKLSEHAFGNALDIARFTFANGAAAEVGPVPGEAESRFLAEVRKAACGPFKTVLGPGSDPDHATHFHLDLAQRRHGGTFCQ